MTIRLFDEIERSDTGPQLHSETDYAYLNRSARPDADRIRFVLEDWFSRYPKKKQVRLQERFRKNEYESAFFELYLHEIMLQQGFECQVEPIVGSCEKRPDFLVFHQDRKCFYLEAIVPELPKYDARHDKHLRVFYDELDKIQSEFSSFVEVEGNLTKQPGLKNFKRRLEKLNPDELQEPMVIVLDGNGNIRSEKNDSEASLESIYEMDVAPKIIITISPKSTGQRGTQGNISGSFTGIRDVNTSNMI
ncbi:MAG TPA: hypothetical protein ACFYD2_10205 [Candidatus Avalokitesvara rifleensis]|uniref:hypothetical protein n=1 Tax=Candidatus Avalokitesvara rifleensis TaxID=3367620 RepID=UPI0027135EDF|nr:hypothetical protein [Candidatus Brocadiales bacterium]